MGLLILAITPLTARAFTLAVAGRAALLWPCGVTGAVISGQKLTTQRVALHTPPPSGPRGGGVGTPPLGPPVQGASALGQAPPPLPPRVGRRPAMGLGDLSPPPKHPPRRAPARAPPRPSAPPGHGPPRPALAPPVAGLKSRRKAPRPDTRRAPPLAKRQGRPATRGASGPEGATGALQKPLGRVGPAAAVLLALAISDHTKAGGVAVAALALGAIARPKELIRAVPLRLGPPPGVGPHAAPKAKAAAPTKAAERPVKGRVADVWPVPQKPRPP